MSQVAFLACDVVTGVRCVLAREVEILFPCSLILSVSQFLLLQRKQVSDLIEHAADIEREFLDRRNCQERQLKVQILKKLRESSSAKNGSYRSIGYAAG